MADPADTYAAVGFAVFDTTPSVKRWADQAYQVALTVTTDPAMQAKWLRHGQTWFVGVDVLPNDETGSIAGVPLLGPWEDCVQTPAKWHPAQVSVMYPGYPKQDLGESDSAHRFRKTRCAAHVDGLHLEDGRRILREPHAFILGVPLNESDASPLTIWPGSHLLMRTAFQSALDPLAPLGGDVTEVYKETRANCFASVEPVAIKVLPGQSVLLHPLLLHGVAPWTSADRAPPEGRMMAYFRPTYDNPQDWLLG